MLKLIGNLIYGIGWIVGGVKYRLGIMVHVPERYSQVASVNFCQDQGKKCGSEGVSRKTEVNNTPRSRRRTMARIQPVQANNADPKAAQLLQSVEKKMGSIPNLISTLANSPAAAQAYLGFAQSLAGGALSAPLREQISLAVGQTNDCDYCVAAHSSLGQKAGLDDEDILNARRATANDEKAAVALGFARKIVDNRGFVSDEDVEEVRRAGFTEGEIAEIVANVALNLFTNYFNHVAETEVDFPAVPCDDSVRCLDNRCSVGPSIRWPTGTVLPLFRRDGMSERANEDWLRQLSAEGEERDHALSDLRKILLRGLRHSLSSRSDVDESFLEDAVQDSLLRILDCLPQFEGAQLLCDLGDVDHHTDRNDLASPPSLAGCITRPSDTR